MPFRGKVWQIENYDEETRRKVKAYAVLQGISIAEALKRIVSEWEAKNHTKNR